MVMSRRVAETQRLDDCCFSRRGTEVQAQRRGGLQGLLCHAKTQRRGDWTMFFTRKGTEVQAQRRGDNGIKDWEECLGSFFIADNSPCIEYDTKNKDDS